MWLCVVCCAELPDWANIAIFCLLMLGGKKEIVWDFCEKVPSEICQDFMMMILSPCCYDWPRSNLGQIAEGNSLSKKEQTDEIEQQMRMIKQWRWTNNEDVVMTSGRGGEGLRCGLAWSDWQHSSWEWDGLDLRRDDKQIVQKRLTGFHKFWQVPPLLVQCLVDDKIYLVGKRCLFVNWQERTNATNWQTTSSEMKFVKGMDKYNWKSRQIQLKVQGWNWL